MRPRTMSQVVARGSLIRHNTHVMPVGKANVCGLSATSLQPVEFGSVLQQAAEAHRAVRLAGVGLSPYGNEPAQAVSCRQ